MSRRLWAIGALLVTAATIVLAVAIAVGEFPRGLLLLGCGESAIRFCPPLCVSAEQVDKALTILEAVLTERPAPVLLA